MDSRPSKLFVPKGMAYGYAFSVFNSISFPLVMGTNMLLYFKRLEAPATVLGLVVAFDFIFMALQIPAAKFVQKIGYRAFALRGYSTRFTCTALMALVAWVPSLSTQVRMGMMLVVIVVYQISRGISSTVYYPWIAQLLPEKLSGLYLMRDRICNYTGAIIVTFFSAWYFRSHLLASDFDLTFACSFLAGLCSIFFLRRMPDPPVEVIATQEKTLSIKKMWEHLPFRQFLIVNFFVCTALGTGLAFWVPFLKDHHQFTDSSVLLVSMFNSLVSMLSIFIVTKMIDRFDHRAVFELSIALLGLQYTAWCLLAAGVIPIYLSSMILITLLSAVSTSMFTSLNLRFLVGVAPEANREHFIASFSGVINITMGLTPVIWGLLIDHFDSWRIITGFWNWNIYTVLYLVLALTIAAVGIFGPPLRERKKMSTQVLIKEIFFHTPKRAIGWILERRP